jgi:hypothetical protein
VTPRGTDLPRRRRGQHYIREIHVLNEQTELLREMLDPLRVIAEPALAKRDEALRAALLQVVGRGKKQSKAVLLMDGSRTQPQPKPSAALNRRLGEQHGNSHSPAMPALDGQRHPLRVTRHEGDAVLLFPSP